MEPEPVEQTAAGAVEDIGAVAAGSSDGDGDGDREQEVEDGADRRASVEIPRAPVTPGALGPFVEPLDPSMVEESPGNIGESSKGAGGCGASRGGVGPNGSPPRDSAKGKGPVVKGEESAEIPIGPVEFRPAAGSSGHRPITKDDFAKFVDDATLDRLLQDNLAVVAAVVAAREERQRAIALA